MHFISSTELILSVNLSDKEGVLWIIKSICPLKQVLLEPTEGLWRTVIIVWIWNSADCNLHGQ